MTVRLSDVLRDLADDRPSDAGLTHDGEAARGAWAKARRVRRRRQVAGALGIAAGVVVVAATAASLPRLNVEPAPPSGPTVVGGVPDRIYPVDDVLLSVRRAPTGPAALVFTGNDFTVPQVVVAARSDDYRSLEIPSLDYAHDPVVVSGERFVALSRDGRWAAIVQTTQESAGGPLDATVSLVAMDTGASSVVDYPGVVLSSAVFSPDGTRLALLGGVVTDQRPDGYTTESNVFVQEPDGTVRDLGRANSLLGWTPEGEVVISGPTRTVAVEVLPDAPTSSRDLGPNVDWLGGGGASALSPDGQLVATVGLVGSTSDGADPFRLVVTRISDGKTVQTVDWAEVGDARFVGWQDTTTPVVALQEAWTSDGEDPFQLVAEASSGPQVLTVASADARPFRVAAAQDLLADVRVAAPPPAIPWNDLGTALPRLASALGTTQRVLVGGAIVLGLVALSIVGVLLNRRVRRRDPEVHSGDQAQPRGTLMRY